MTGCHIEIVKTVEVSVMIVSRCGQYFRTMTEDLLLASGVVVKIVEIFWPAKMVSYRM